MDTHLLEEEVGDFAADGLSTSTELYLHVLSLSQHKHEPSSSNLVYC